MNAGLEECTAFSDPRPTSSAAPSVAVASSRTAKVRRSTIRLSRPANFKNVADPFLSGTMGASWMAGVQSRKVMTTPKRELGTSGYLHDGAGVC